ncbi:FAD/NAD(P)-binding domain-containing protein [Serendipita vermifera]|nr:FAD/NAD(P)-binding domain-containing protein [Serendipita vermifera]
MSSNRPLNANKGRKRVIVLGAGWASTSFLQRLSTKYYQPLVISPRPYFVFTPLLASTSVGTLEPRTALEGVRSIKGTESWEAAVTKIDLENKEVHCISPLQNWDPSKAFKVKYDKLVLAVGAHTQTFNIPGVREHAHFLKETKDAIKIRRRILACFEEASLPSTSERRKKQLLHFCIVGGGPTGVEFSAELHDLIHDDLSRSFPTLAPLVKISLYDVAPRILNMFDSALADFAMRHFARQGIEVHTQRTVTRVEDGVLHLKEEDPVEFGMLVWSTGLEMTPLIKGLQGVMKDPKAGRIVTDGHLRVLRPDSESTEIRVIRDVYAMGDCSVIEKDELPATAQVASQQGLWLRKHFNLLGKRGILDIPPKPLITTQPQQEGKNEPVQKTVPEVGTQKDVEESVDRGFRYHNILTLAYLGSWNAIAQRSKGHGIRGRFAWFLWRGAYMTKTISWRNKLRVPILWAINYIFGRDITHV